MNKGTGHIKSWKEIEYFDEAWKERIQLMAGYIPPGTNSLMDIGCGRMWLREYLPASCKYYGIDYVNRGPGSVVFDLNQHEFPGFSCDVAFVSGCLEYIDDCEWLINNISGHNDKCIISYCTKDVFADPAERRRLFWKNDLTEQQLIALFEKNRMNLDAKDRTNTGNSIYVFRK
jgi:hypothetical protein